MSDVFVVLKTGVYIKGVIGVFTDLGLAKACADQAAAVDIDSYHGYVVEQHPLNEMQKLVVSKATGTDTANIHEEIYIARQSLPRRKS